MRRFQFWFGLIIIFLWLALLAVLLHASPVHHIKPVAAPQFAVTGGTPVERQRITKLESQLNFSQQPMVSYWQITILDAKAWDYMIRQYHIENETATAFTVMEQARTFLNEDYLATTGTDVPVRHTIAHEAGHLICECGSEDKANDIAAVLVGK